MSWSVSFIGTPENISQRLTDNSEKLNGVSKEEYDAALPHLVALVGLNFNKTYPMAIQITANGHAYGNAGDETTGYSNCNVTITALTGELV